MGSLVKENNKLKMLQNSNNNTTANQCLIITAEMINYNKTLTGCSKFTIV